MQEQQQVKKARLIGYAVGIAAAVVAIILRFMH